EVVRLRLFPTGEDNTLAEDRAVLVASLVAGFPLNTGAIIAEEINCRVLCPFVDQAITAALEPYKHLHPHMDDMKATERQPQSSHLPTMRSQRTITLHPSAGRIVEGNRRISTPPVERHVTGTTIHSESTTLAKPPPAAEAAPHDPVSVTATTKATIDGSGVHHK
ncbi:hypothetical protein HAX54_010066, partial [Datura stramonium]|nr:hypothetical protein [Datura stramonium]